MSKNPFLSINKLRGPGHLLKAARHNRRAIQAELGAHGHIDPTRTVNNETLTGASTPEGVADQAKALMKAAGVTKLRKDAVVALEALFSLSAGHGIDSQAYFAKCLEWARKQFGGMGNILSADIHNDESNPHMHVLILPLRDGRMVGSDMMGNRDTLAARHKSFYDEVAKQFGLAKPPARLVGATKTDAIARVLAALSARKDPALKSLLWPAIRASIESNPAPWMALLDIAAPVKTKRLKSSTAILTGKGKGPKKEPNPTGFRALSQERTLSCVGFTKSEDGMSASPNTLDGHNRGTADVVRVREEEMPSEWWDCDIGAFQPEHRPVRSQKAAAETWVEAILPLPKPLTADPVRPKHQDDQPATLTPLARQATGCGVRCGDVVEQAPIGTNGCRPAADLRNHKVPSGCARTSALGDATGMLTAQRRGEAGVIQRHWIELAAAPSLLSKAATPPMQLAATSSIHLYEKRRSSPRP